MHGRKGSKFEGLWRNVVWRLGGGSKGLTPICTDGTDLKKGNGKGNGEMRDGAASPRVDVKLGEIVADLLVGRLIVSRA